MNSKEQSNKPSSKIFKIIAIVFFIFGFLGFCDAAYLTIKHYQGAIPPCSFVDGCESVLTSDYSAIAGVPISLLGMGYYFSVCILAFAYLDTKKQQFLRTAAVLSFVGFAISLFLVYLQVFVIRYICLYCMWSATTSAVLFLAGITVFKKRSAVVGV